MLTLNQTLNCLFQCLRSMKLKLWTQYFVSLKLWNCTELCDFVYQLALQTRSWTRSKGWWCHRHVRVRPVGWHISTRTWSSSAATWIKQWTCDRFTKRIYSHLLAETSFKCKTVKLVIYNVHRIILNGKQIRNINILVLLWIVLGDLYCMPQAVGNAIF